MKLHLTRDSVAAGDDADAPHDRELQLPDGLAVDAIVGAIAKANYLASIQGGKATWSLTSRRPLAVLAQQWAQPKLFFVPNPRDLTKLKFAGGTLHVHATYYAQRDPDHVFDVLQRLSEGAFD